MWRMSSIGSCGTTPMHMVNAERQKTWCDSRPVGTNTQLAMVAKAGVERVFCILLNANDVSFAIRSMVDEFMKIAGGEISTNGLSNEYFDHKHLVPG